MQRPVQSRPVLIWLMMFLPLLGCRKPEAGAPSRPGPAERRIGVSLASVDSPWRAQLKADIAAAAVQQPDWHLDILDAQNDAAKQRAQLDEFLGSRMDVVIVDPIDSSTATEPVAKLINAGIPVIVLERPVIGDKYTCFIASDPKQIGTEAGNWLAERLKGKGKIVDLRGPVDSHWTDTLHAAFQTALRDPGYRFVFSEHVDPPKVDAAKVMDTALSRLEKIDAVFAYDDAAAYAAYQTVKAAGRKRACCSWASVVCLTRGPPTSRKETLAQRSPTRPAARRRSKLPQRHFTAKKCLRTSCRPHE